MIIAGIYSFNLGREIIEERFGAELAEIEQAITSVDSSLCKTKTSLEKTMPGRTLYNVCAKMTIFHNLGVIDVGVEIVPVKVFAEEMSTGVSYFEQFIWDLEQRGVADIDIPVLILGVAASTPIS
ncbi:MAG TPA: hypothetical protein DCL15_23845 [Chloroflexi bacterium]|nr:hypothetical protein [Chloroflexota bacterium]HHW87895.1 hypothetical protein [Chloroflexota bacterium]